MLQVRSYCEKAKERNLNGCPAINQKVSGGGDIGDLSLEQRLTDEQCRQFMGHECPNKLNRRPAFSEESSRETPFFGLKNE